jgi:hypothetical protein
MLDQYIQTAEASGSGSAVASLTVSAGSAIVAFLWDGSNSSGPTTHTVSDAQGSYTPIGPSALDASNAVWVQVFVLENANAGSHTITGTVDTGNACYLRVAESGSSGVGAASGANSLFQSGPGGATDAITSGSVTVTAAATLIAMSTDSGQVSIVDDPATGTGFTSRDNNANSTIGSWRLESKAVAANAAGTFTAVLGLDNYVTAAVAILNSGGGGGGGGGTVTLMGQICL